MICPSPHTDPAASRIATDDGSVAGSSGEQYEARLIDLPTIDSQTPDAIGAITVLEAPPFEIKRIYWIHGAGAGEMRGHHAHRTLCQILVAVSGAFEIKAVTDTEEIRFMLDTPRRGLLLGPGLWRTICALKENSVLMVAASATFNEADYIRDFDAFLDFRKDLREMRRNIGGIDQR